MIKSIELSKACKLLNPGPTVLVTSAHGEKRNVMAASWSMAVDFSPPKVAVVIAEGTYTRELIEASGIFALNIPSRELAAATLGVGHTTGRDLDKFGKYNLGTFIGNKIKVPLIEKCVGWLECQVIAEPHIQNTYDLFIGEVIAAHADDRVFSNGHWLAPTKGLETLHYIAGGNFLLGSEMISLSPL